MTSLGAVHRPRWGVSSCVEPRARARMGLLWVVWDLPDQGTLNLCPLAGRFFIPWTQGSPGVLVYEGVGGVGSSLAERGLCFPQAYGRAREPA